MRLSLALAIALLVLLPTVRAQELPLADVHIHYSHDARDELPPDAAVAILRRAGLAKAFVSSSPDDGTRALYQLAPDLVVPVLRPYRRRGETGSWLQDDTVVAHVEARLATHRYAGIGEFHVHGADADLPVMRRMVALARERGFFLHVHGDREAIERIFAQDPQARILWAHAGFAGHKVIREALTRFPNLWCDLAFRFDHLTDGKLHPTWRALFLDFPDRFLVGTDSYTPDRWQAIVPHAEEARAWLAELPPEAARAIAGGNAAALARWE